MASPMTHSTATTEGRGRVPKRRICWPPVLQSDEIRGTSDGLMSRAGLLPFPTVWTSEHKRTAPPPRRGESQASGCHPKPMTTT